MFRLPSSMDFPGSKTFFHVPPISCIIARPGAYAGKICKGGTAMEPEFSHGDVDDLIYQEEWTASER